MENRPNQDQAPKRILAMDGGGIRGALTLGILEVVEAKIREKQNDPDLRLCDHFDFIGGTSTGSIIAAGLATGMAVSEISALYQQMGGKIFSKQRKPWVPNAFNKMFRYFLSADYDEKYLEEELKKQFNFPIGSEKVKCHLCIVVKRADTFSTWPVINHPKAKYYEQNKDILLWELVRASSAAPTYFKPKKMHVGNGQHGVFVDGGVSMANNPALQMFLIATLKGFPFRWPVGKDKLSILSVGTGYSIKTQQMDKILDKRGILWGKDAIDMFMVDANALNQTMLQYLSDSPTKEVIDREVGNLEEDNLFGKEAFHYLRYNAQMSTDELNDNLGFNYSEAKVKDLVQMDKGENVRELYEIGKRVGEKYVKAEHFI